MLSALGSDTQEALLEMAAAVAEGLRVPGGVR
jgi:hypothetical protein